MCKVAKDTNKFIKTDFSCQVYHYDSLAQTFEFTESYLEKIESGEA